MISTLSESAPFITVSVGNEIRVRDGNKPGTGDVPSAPGKNIPILTTNTTKGKRVDEPFNKEQVQATVAGLKEALKHVESRVELSVDEEINQVIFRVVDKESGDLIRQIPSEKVVELARLFSENSGLFVEENI